MAQQQIPLELVKVPVKVDPALIEAQGTLLGAIKLSISLGGFDADKEVYKALDIDAGHWSRIHRGEAHFPVDKLCSLMDLCGNEAPLMWLLHARGYDIGGLHKRETEVERQLRIAREELAKERQEREVERRLFRELRVAA